MKNRTKRLLLYSFFIIILMLFVSPFILYWGANQAPVRKYITQWIQEKTNHHGRIKDYQLTLIPHPGLKISQVEYRYPGNKRLFYADSLFISFNSLKLFQGQLVIDQIVVDHPRFPDLQGSPNSSPIFLTFNPQGFRKWLEEEIFPFFPKSQESIRIGIKNFTTPMFEKLNGNLFISKNTGKLFSDLNIKNFAIKYENCPRIIRNAVLFSYLKIQTVQLHASMTKPNKLSVNISTTGFSLQDNEAPLFQAENMQWLLHSDSSAIKAEVKQAAVTYPSMKFGVLLNSDLIKKKAALQFKATDLNVNETRDAALRLISSNRITQSIFDIVKGGFCPGIRVGFKGSGLSDLFDGDRMVLAGQLEKGLVHIPQTPLTASDVIGTANIEKGVLSVGASNGLIQGSRINSGTLNVDLLNHPDFPFSGNFMIDTDLSRLPHTLVSLLPDTLLAKELKKVHNVKGRGLAALSLDFPSMGSLSVNVKSQPFRIAGRYDRIPGDISIDNIVFEFSPNAVQLKEINATINHNRIENCAIDVQLDKTFDLDLQSGPMRIALGPTLKWLNQYDKTKTMISPVKKGSGTLLLNRVAVKGPLMKPEKWNFSIEGKADHIGLSTSQKRDEINALSFDFSLKPPDYQIRHINLQSLNHEWLKYFAPTKIISQIKSPMTIKDARILFQPQKAHIDAQLIAAPGTQATAELTGDSMDTLSLATLKIKDADKSDVLIEFPAVSNRIKSFDFKGRVSTMTLLKFLNPEQIWANKINRLTNGKELIINQMDSNQIHITTKALDLTPMLSHGKTLRINSKILPEHTIFLNADTVQYKKLQFSNVQSKIIISNDGIYLRILNADLCELNTKGYINYENGELYTNFPITAENKDNAQSLLSCLLDKEKFMDGKYSFTADLSSNSAPSQIKHSFNGQAAFSAENGRIYKLTLLSRILSVLNVSNVFKGKIPDITQQGFAYKKVDMTFDIENSVLKIDKGILDGADMTMIFDGTIDPLNDKISVTCLVAPFKTVDMIIEKIPIVNTLLGGRLVSLPVQATGKLSDPLVIPLHPSAVGSGLVNMMTTILKAPITLIDKLTPKNTKEQE